ncbi:transcriptional activator Hac1p [Diutina catenulata]
MSTDVVVKSEEVPVDLSFKSSLPPRKRAKTEEEKEQRRVERILRNRRAAHASREKKRKHVEYLEAYVYELESKLQLAQDNLEVVMGKLSPTQVASLGDLADVRPNAELKERISSNMTGTKRETDVKSEFSPSPSETPVKKRKLQEEEEEEEQDLLTVKDNTYYNYLSPVSINSPINSPLDLTLTSNTESCDSLSPESSYGLMEQSSAVTAMREFDAFSDEAISTLLIDPQPNTELDQGLDIEEFLAL